MAQQSKPYDVYLDAEGQRYLAQDQRPFNWNLQVVGEHDKPRERAVKVAEFRPEWPGREESTQNAVAALRQKQQTLRAEAEQEVQAVETQIQQLLAIEGPKS